MIAIIPCRKGSKGIPNKNFIDLCGKPLWRWTFDTAMESGVFDKIIVSSDNEELKFLDIADSRVIIDYNRGEPFHTDTAQLDPLMKFYAELYDCDSM
jgi:CMP-N-acetylneuraminic acid synthetase